MKSALSAEQGRWFGAANLIALVRAEPGITRASATDKLGIGSGGAAELVARLRRMRLLDESPVMSRRRGRPTSVLKPHPEGPVVLVVEIQLSGWRLAAATIDGLVVVLAWGRVSGKQFPAELRTATADAFERYLGRVTAVSVSESLSDNRLAEPDNGCRGEVDWAQLAPTPPGAEQVPTLVGNAATLAGLGEVRIGAARGARCALHLHVTDGVSGALTINGHPVTGAHGRAGEYGHLPFADRSLECPCGARGCWGQAVGGGALARRLGDRLPLDSVRYVRDLVEKSSLDPVIEAAVHAVTSELGAGIGALVNATDPDVVTLGGSAVDLCSGASATFERSYRNGLMAVLRSTAPPVRAGTLRGEAALYGAAAVALDQTTSELALAQWATRRPLTG